VRDGSFQWWSYYKASISISSIAILTIWEGPNVLTLSEQQYFVWCRAGSRGEIGAITPLKPTKITLLTIILYHSENSIRDIRPFCRRPFAVHCFVTAVLRSTLHLSYSSEAVMRRSYLIFLKMTPWIHPWFGTSPLEAQNDKIWNLVRAIAPLPPWLRLCTKADILNIHFLSACGTNERIKWSLGEKSYHLKFSWELLKLTSPMNL